MSRIGRALDCAAQTLQCTVCPALCSTASAARRLSLGRILRDYCAVRAQVKHARTMDKNGPILTGDSTARPPAGPQAAFLHLFPRPYANIGAAHHWHCGQAARRPAGPHLIGGRVGGSSGGAPKCGRGILSVGGPLESLFCATLAEGAQTCGLMRAKKGAPPRGPS